MAEPLIIPFRHGPFVNLSYLVADIATGRAMVIDPAWDVPAILDAIRQRELRLSHVVVTHAHSDHTNGLEDLIAATGAQVIGHDLDAGELRRIFTGAIDTATEAFELGAVDVTLAHTPGHSPGSLVVAAGSHLFTGDTLGIGSPGRPGSWAEAPVELWASTRHIATAYTGETILHPGHDAGPSPTSTLAQELERNPALLATGYGDFLLALERLTGRYFPRPSEGDDRAEN